MTISVDEFLAHNGVKGMKWGVVKNPNRTSQVAEPNGQTRSEIRQAKRDAKAQNFDALAARYDNKLQTRNNLSPSDRKILTQYRDRATRDAESVRNHKLTSNQKKIAIGAAVVGTVLIGAAATRYLNTGEFNRIRTIGFNNRKDRISPIEFPKNLKYSSATTPDDVFSDVVKGVNPRYGLPGTVSNCRRASFAYEMRRRGYDVRATKTTNGYGQNAQGLINAITPGSTRPTDHRTAVKKSLREAYSKSLINGETPIGKTVPDFLLDKKFGFTNPKGKEIFDALSQQPNNSRGELSIRTKFGKHSIVYELFDGKPVIFDVQRNKKYDSPDTFEEMAKYITKAGFTRLDDKPLNTNYLARWVTSSAK